MAFVNNYSTSFRWWDRALGTDDKYRAYRERMTAAKKGNMSPQEFAALEQKLMEQTEKEGLEAEKVAESYQYGAKTKVA